MHVAIDIGHKYTYIACWQKGKILTEACIRVRIPGMTKFCYTNNKSFRDREGMKEYLNHLYCEYILPSRISLDSAALSFPTILNLHTHRMLLDVLEEIFGLPEVSIIPQPLALVHGYNLQNPHFPLSGDIMVIQNAEVEFNFAFMSVLAANSLTLEKQFTADPSLAVKEAELIGLYSPGWKLDAVLLGEEPPYPPGLDELIKSLPKEVLIISGQNLQFTTVDGLRWESQDNIPNLSCTYNMIYPYEFFIEKNTGRASFELVKIPFDTVNLELECGASYQILSLDSSDIYNLAVDPGRINLRIYESGKSGYFEPSVQPNLIFEIDSLKSDLPERLLVYLDMDAASLGLTLTPHKPDRNSSAPLDFRNHLLSGQEKLYEIMKINNDQQMVEEYDNPIMSACHETQDDLTNQIELTLFRLYALLQLWQGK